MAFARPLFGAMLSALVLCAPGVRAQCPEQPPLQNSTGDVSVGCPCFIPNEEAGAVFDLPAADFPIEILKVRIGWGSQFGGSPPSLEEAIHIYGAGLPDPGVPIFTLPAPQLIDGAINEFNLEPLPGEIIVDSGPFTVTLEFLNQNAANPFAPSVIHDGNGCQPGKNVVFAKPGGWNDACLLGVTGDWVFAVIYRPVNCAAGGTVPDGHLVAGTPLSVAPAAGGNLTLSWGASCAATDNDYEVYEGTLGAYYSHGARLCTTGGATTATFTPAAGDCYYLVVPRNDGAEGSYGFDSGGGGRPPGSPACLTQLTGACP